MKKMFLAGVSALALLVGTGHTAIAADPDPIVSGDWSGFYIGGHLGWAEAGFDGTFKTDSDEEFDLGNDLSGLVGGGHLGFNHQMDSLVFGIEADATMMKLSETSVPSDPDNSAGIEADVDWLGSVRGRVGIAMDDIHIFATGGLAYQQASAFVFDSDERAQFDLDDWGYVAGAGIEWRATEHVSVRAEGLYYFFDEKKSDFSSVLPSSGVEEDSIGLNDTLVLRLGASFHL